MPRKSAPTHSSTTTTAPSTPVKKAARKRPATAPTKSTNSVVAPATVDVTPPTEVVAETPALGAALQEDFSEFLGKLNLMNSQFSSLRTDFRNLEKRWTRELRVAQKSVAKKRRKVGNRAPSGFVKPTLISTELASFLGKTEGTEMARTEVTREINKYIRANALQDKDNGRKINPDAALQSLLKIEAGQELTYFNLQRYMSPHFAKLGQEVPAANIAN